MHVVMLNSYERKMEREKREKKETELRKRGEEESACRIKYLFQNLFEN